MTATRATRRTTNGCASTATSRPSASPSMRAEQLGDIVFVELPEVGRKVKKGDERRGGRVGQGGKRRLQRRSSGEVTETNDSLEAQRRQR